MLLKAHSRAISFPHHEFLVSVACLKMHFTYSGYVILKLLVLLALTGCTTVNVQTGDVRIVIECVAR
jgi:hypothetical protein